MSSTLRLTKTMREQIAAIREVLSPWGLGTALINEGPHLVVKVFDRQGHGHRLTIASTPKCRGSAANKARSTAKRLLRFLNERDGY